MSESEFFLAGPPTIFETQGRGAVVVEVSALKVSDLVAHIEQQVRVLEGVMGSFPDTQESFGPAVRFLTGELEYLGQFPLDTLFSQVPMKRRGAVG